MYNDLGFTVGSKSVVLLEAQSTWSLNIAVRALMYLAKTWQEYIESNDFNSYSSTVIPMPKPELYMVYTGERRLQQDYISLSRDIFGEKSEYLELKVKVIYNSDEKNIITEYIQFTIVYNEQLKKYGRTKKAVLETIRICRDAGILSEYLQEREKEVVDIMMTLFDDEYILKAWGKEREAIGMRKGEAIGMRKGEAKGAMDVATNLKRMGSLSDEDIAKATNLPLETVKAI